MIYAGTPDLGSSACSERPCCKVFFKMLFTKSTYRAPPKRKETRRTLAKTRREQLKRGAMVRRCTLMPVLQSA